ALLHALVEAADLGIRHVAGVQELGIAHDAREDLVETLELGYRLGEPVAVELRQPPAITLGERLRIPLRPVEIPCELGRIGPRIEVAEIPSRQRRLGRYRAFRRADGSRRRIPLVHVLNSPLWPAI